MTFLKSSAYTEVSAFLPARNARKVLAATRTSLSPSQTAFAPGSSAGNSIRCNLRHASRRLGRPSFHQCPRSLIQARVAKIEVGEFRFRPASCVQGHGVHAKSERKRVPPKVYKRCAMSLKVNVIFRARGRGTEMCISRCSEVARA